MAALLLATACAAGKRRVAVASTPPAPLDLARVYELLKAGRTQDAIVPLDELIDVDPTNMRLRMERGYARQTLGQREAAADEFAFVAREPGPFQSQAQGALAEIATESKPTSIAVRRDALLNEGYADLRQGNRLEARRKFAAALVEDPGRPEIIKQLGYMSVADGDMVDAVKKFEGERRLVPRDYEAALELGYLYDSLHDESGAEASFAAARLSPDARIRDAASSALKNVRARAAPFYVDVYASPYYTSRFSDKVAYFEASAGYKPEPDGPISFYLDSRYTQDTLSRGGVVPEIYSDNYASLSPGIRYQPKGFNASLTADWGLAINLLPTADHPGATEFDGRVVLADYHYWEGPDSLFADVGASAGFYSRYRDNVIGYLQSRGGIKAWDNSRSQLSLYAPVNVYKDTNRDFFNNAVEAGAGLEFQPSTKINLKFRAEYLRGTYMGITGRDPNPYGPHYNDVRLTLIYAGHFARQPSADAPASAHPRGYSW